MSRTGFLHARCWLDEDGQHVWLSHRCNAKGELTTMLPWPTWHVEGTKVWPSIWCNDCDLHYFATIDVPS